MYGYCAYCGRPIESSCVSKNGKHWHATENDRGERSTDRACWELSAYGAVTLIRSDP
jgi:hypothetical protein